ncbi:BZ3500_MvSof-1268-A1-R1_Chr7-1g09259 [Microbotryum saponariae]|uniref:Protein BIG1 n=1 Tax=Microbotryum saponariae TaxID=289078 RepID=A0A2X0L2Z7_9BASI|nr:BZ3501_MvSof-1269-A2-R1_Chr7-1g08964 [Microbotryum saponariae]SDA03103.1 BZ3500_MvSof-1268-A1-R1_Chr7-1g09259 [Microbotryum saponariae]
MAPSHNSKSSVSRWAVTLAALTTIAVGVEAFANTFPIVAWADRPHSSLSTLASTSPSSSSRSGTQASFSSSDAAADLCSLQAILLVSAPGLHYSDLPLLPTTPTGIRARVDYYADSSLTRAYVPLANGVLTTPERVARTFIKQCGAVLQTDDYASFWQGDAAKTLRIETVQGLDEWELVGVKARQGRRELLNKIDEAIQAHLHTLQGPYLVVLTSLPEASTQALASITPLTKRQALDLDDKALEIEEEALSSLSDLEDALDETPVPSSTIGTDDPDTFAAQDRPIIESVTDKAAQAIDAGIDYVASAFAPDPTSIFEVKPNSGLLHRYVFFTPALILCILISFLILIPLLVFTSQALTTVQTVYGLEHKMTGSVGTDGSKGS